MKITINEKTVEHPLEDVLGIESGSTVVEYFEAEKTTLADSPLYDAKDDDIEDQLETIYVTAMTQVAQISEDMERVEGKFKARIGEVTATMLNVALNSVREKRQMKEHKDKLNVAAVAAGTPQTVNNNVVVADRNEILRALAAAASVASPTDSQSDVIDGQIVDEEAAE